MMTNSYDFSLCDLHIRLECEQPLSVEGDFLPFVCAPSAPALHVSAVCADALTQPQGIVTRRTAEFLTIRSENDIFRCRTTHLNAAPYACTQYSLQAPQQVRLTVNAADWHRATHHMHLCSTLSLPQLLLHFQTLVLHASYIVTNGRAVLFAAPSQTGKSTQARLWQEHRGAFVVNGDKAAVSLRGLPTAHGVPFSGTSGICHNVSAPLFAVVLLSQSPENHIRRLRPLELLPLLSRNIFAEQSVAEEWSLALQLMLTLAEQVPVFSLACTPDERAVTILETALLGL